MRVRFVNNDGSGFSDAIEVPAGSTIADLLAIRGITNPADYSLRHNGQECVIPEDRLAEGDRIAATVKPGTVAASQPLNEGDRVTVAPKKVAGANS